MASGVGSTTSAARPEDTLAPRPLIIPETLLPANAASFQLNAALVTLSLVPVVPAAQEPGRILAVTWRERQEPFHGVTVSLEGGCTCEHARPGENCAHATATVLLLNPDVSLPWLDQVGRTDPMLLHVVRQRAQAARAKLQVEADEAPLAEQVRSALDRLVAGNGKGRAAARPSMVLLPLLARLDAGPEIEEMVLDWLEGPRDARRDATAIELLKLDRYARTARLQAQVIRVLEMATGVNNQVISLDAPVMRRLVAAAEGAELVALLRWLDSGGRAQRRTEDPWEIFRIQPDLEARIMVLPSSLLASLLASAGPDLRVRLGRMLHGWRRGAPGASTRTPGQGPGR